MDDWCMCYECYGLGYIINCMDDLCHGRDECMHGDNVTCRECDGEVGYYTHCPMCGEFREQCQCPDYEIDEGPCEISLERCWRCKKREQDRADNPKPQKLERM